MCPAAHLTLLDGGLLPDVRWAKSSEHGAGVNSRERAPREASPKTLIRPEWKNRPYLETLS